MHHSLASESDAPIDGNCRGSVSGFATSKNAGCDADCESDVEASETYPSAHGYALATRFGGTTHPTMEQELRVISRASWGGRHGSHGFQACDGFEWFRFAIKLTADDTMNEPSVISR